MHPDAAVITCDWLEGPVDDLNQAELKQPSGISDPEQVRYTSIAFTPWVVHAAWVKRSCLPIPRAWDESFDRLSVEDHVFWFHVLLDGLPAYSPHTGVYYRTETAGRRHNADDLERYVRNVDLAVRTNVSLLKEKGIPFSAAFRSSLIRLYLNLFSSCPPGGSHPVSDISLRGISEFGPRLVEAAINRDFGAILCRGLGPAHYLQLKGCIKRLRQ
jgi:hypothetical protein